MKLLCEPTSIDESILIPIGFLYYYLYRITVNNKWGLSLYKLAFIVDASVFNP